MVPLLIQILAVLGATAVLRVVLGRLGVELGLPQAVAAAVLVFLATTSLTNMREQWKVLDQQREATEYLSDDPIQAQSTCTAVGVDTFFLSFLGSRIPVSDRFYMETASQKGVGEYCIRFMLLPRVQVARPEDAPWTVLWDPPSRRTLEEARRRGDEISTWDRTHVLVRRR